MCENYLRGFRAGLGRLVLASWVDNVYVASNAPSEACELLELVFSRLRSEWCLECKEGSAELLVCDGFDVSGLSNPLPLGIKHVRFFDVLGFRISSNASMSLQWRQLLVGAWAAFYANVRCKSWRTLGVNRRLTLLDRVVKPIVLYKLQAWVPSKFWIRQVRKLERHMVSRALDNHRLPFEDLKVFWQRVSRHVRGIIGDSVSDWAVEWMKSTVAWDDHCARDFSEQERYFSGPEFSRFVERSLNIHDGLRNEPSEAQSGFGLSSGEAEFTYKTSFSWAARLSRHLDAEYFNSVRVLECRSQYPVLRTHTRTSTRRARGRVFPRYHDGVAFCKETLPA